MDSVDRLNIAFLENNTLNDSLLAEVGDADDLMVVDNKT